MNVEYKGLPHGWIKCQLKDVASLREDLVEPSDVKDEIVTLFSVPAFDAGVLPEIVPGKDIGSTKHRVEAGDVLFCKMNPRKNRVWLVENCDTEIAVCSSEFLPLIPREATNAKFLALMLKSPTFQKAAMKKAKAATKSRERVNPQEVMRLPVALPEDINVQTAIAKELEQQLAEVENMRQAALSQKEAAAAMRSAMLREMFPYKEGDDLPEGWRRIELGSLFELDLEQIDQSDRAFWVLPFLGLENIESHTRRFVESDVDAKEAESACFKFDANHVLYGKLRPYLDKVYLPDKEGRCSLEILPLKPNDGYSREFIALIMQSQLALDCAVKYSTGGRMPRADTKRLLELKVPVPVDQNACDSLASDFTQRLTSFHASVYAVQKQAEAIQAMPSAILRETFDFQRN